MALSIRAATASDETHWRRLWAGYVAFSGIELAEDIVSLTWSRLIDPAAPLFARLAILDGGRNARNNRAMQQPHFPAPARP